MATRDYVRRTSGRKKPSGKKPNKKSNVPAKKLSWKIIALAIALVIGFVVGLYYLNQEEPVDVTVVNTPANTSTQEVKKLPPAPKENFEYEKILENKTVQVADKPHTQIKKTQRPYQMQCGAYRIQKQAEERQATIIFNTGIEATVKRTEKNGSVWHRVVLGPYKSKRKAEVDKHKLQALDMECGIWYWTY